MHMPPTRLRGEHCHIQPARQALASVLYRQQHAWQGIGIGAGAVAIATVLTLRIPCLLESTSG